MFRHKLLKGPLAYVYKILQALPANNNIGQGPKMSAPFNGKQSPVKWLQSFNCPDFLPMPLVIYASLN